MECDEALATLAATVAATVAADGEPPTHTHSSSQLWPRHTFMKHLDPFDA